MCVAGQFDPLGRGVWAALGIRNEDGLPRVVLVLLGWVSCSGQTTVPVSVSRVLRPLVYFSLHVTRETLFLSHSLRIVFVFVLSNICPFLFPPRLYF